MDFLTEVMYGNCSTIFKVNVKTKKMYAYKHLELASLTEDILENFDSYCRWMIESGLVFEEDLWEFEQFFNLEAIVSKCQMEHSSKILAFRSKAEGRMIWHRIVLMVPENFSQENPFILIYCYQLNRSESDFYDESYVMTTYVYKIVKSNLTTNEYAIIKEPVSEMIRKERMRKGNFTDNISCEDYDQIHPDDLDMFKKCMNREWITEYFEEDNDSYTLYYRRKIGNIYRWVKMSILPGRADSSKGNTLYFYVQDVHREILKIIDQSMKTDISMIYGLGNADASKIYYENLMSLLSIFTQSFVDYGILDMRQGYYIRYKVRGAGVVKSLPTVVKYEDIVSNMQKAILAPESLEMLKAYDSLEKIKEALKNQVTAEYTCLSQNGKRYRVVMQKKQAVNGIPTKVIIYTQEAPADKQLKVVTFGDFQVFNEENLPVKFKRKKSQEVFAYLIDRQGYSVTSKELVEKVLEKNGSDLKAVKYMSTLIRGAMSDLKAAGFGDVIVKEAQSVRINKEKVDCDFYHLMEGNVFYWTNYKNEYMKEYSWAEETNGEIMTWEMD